MMMSVYLYLYSYVPVCMFVLACLLAAPLLQSRSFVVELRRVFIFFSSVARSEVLRN